MADPQQGTPSIIVDEQAAKSDVPEETAALASAPVNSATTPSGSSVKNANLSPPSSPPASPPSPESRRSPSDDYYFSRPRTDRFGNPIPDRRRPSAMSSVYGGSKVQLPGDLGPNDPRRPRSPAPGTLPGDLGRNDPRRPRSRSPAIRGPRVRSGSDASEIAPAEGERILKDPKAPPSPPAMEEAAGESENEAYGDYDNDTDPEYSIRGRERKRPEPGRTTAGKSVNVQEDSDDSDRDKAVRWASGVKPDPTKGESKLSFLSDGQGSSATGSEKKRVHPSTAFDLAPPSAFSSPLNSDDEHRSELRAAQKLSLSMSNIHSTPSAHRVIRQIIRGDYAHFQREAEKGRKRQRMYLVATDISPEAEYALEWTIGTVLRDGDTLFAVYAVDEESAGHGGDGGVEIGHGADMVKDTAYVLNRLPTNTVPPNGPSALSKTGQSSTSPDNRSRSRGPGAFSSAEGERRRALEDISARCMRLLRKTRLQVRVVVEVFHCKSPRHMITEVIDFLSPTLVIIGSRGRSAVKGVLLGSFSNYLVTKSSVPVMVARKKLRKHSTAKRNRDGTVVPYSGSGRTGRFSNIIEAPKGKGLRVKGWEQVGID